MGFELQAGRREPHRSRRAVDEAEAVLRLEGGHVVGHDRLRVAEGQRRGRKRTPLGHLVEGPEPAKVVHRQTR